MWVLAMAAVAQEEGQVSVPLNMHWSGAGGLEIPHTEFLEYR